MTGLTVRRLVLENITAVAIHSPFPILRRTGVKAKYLTECARRRSIWKTDPERRSTGSSRLLQWCVWSPFSFSPSTGSSNTHFSSTFSLITSEEMEFQKEKENSDLSSFSFTPPVVLFTRPTFSVLRAVGGAVANVVVGSLLSPIIFIALLLEKVSTSRSVLDVFRGVLFSSFWAILFGVTAACAGAQQLILCTWHGCIARPWHYLFNRTIKTRQHSSGVLLTRDGIHMEHHREWRGSTAVPDRTSARTWWRWRSAPRLWSGISCKFEPPTPVGRTHPMLQQYVPDDRIWDCARDRRARSEKLARSSRQRRSASSSSFSSAFPLGGKDHHVGEGAAEHPSYYSLLGVPEQATSGEIKAAYKRLALKVHPDRNPSGDAAQQFHRLRTAYQVLSNPASRKSYDIGGERYEEERNTGKKNRDALRAFFGGEYCTRLIGDTFLNSFTCRVVDKVDFTEEELSVLRERMLEGCAKELLHQYLAPTECWMSSFSPRQEIDNDNTNRSSTSTGSTCRKESVTATLPFSFCDDACGVDWKQWEMNIKNIWHSHDGPLNVGLGGEVLYIVGREYEQVVLYVTGGAITELISCTGSTSTCSPTRISFSFFLSSLSKSHLGMAITRAKLYCQTTLPEDITNFLYRYNGLVSLAKRSKYAGKRQQLSVDSAWYWGSRMIKRTARHSALMMLYDPLIASDEKEQMRRVRGLWVLSQLMVREGQAYKPATRESLARLESSLFASHSKKNP